MLFTPNQDQTIALAGLAQAGKIVTQLAAETEHDETALRASARSLLEMRPDDMQAIFGGAAGVKLGLRTLQSMFKGKSIQSSLIAKELIRYLMSMDQLAARLNQSPSTQRVIEQGLYELNNQFSDILTQTEGAAQPSFDDLYAGIGVLYQKSLSQLPPRIIVRGAKGQLQDGQSVARLRTALFAGVRAGHLWHQLGAKRWHIVFARGAYAKMAQQLAG